MLTRRDLRDVFAKYGFRPLKRFGENYLVDGNIKDKIIAALELSVGDRILEIGPGLGALTLDLAGSGASVVAVEKDRKAAVILGELVGAQCPHLEIVQGDFLDYDLAAWAAGRRIKVAGNLPYYITTPIVEKLIAAAGCIERAVLLVQKEFAERLLAVPGSKEYGALSIFVQYHADVAHVHTVKRTSFYPEPAVDSVVVRLGMRTAPPVEVRDPRAFFAIVRGAFNQRRKTVLNSLSREAVLAIPKDAAAALLVRAGVDPAARPETLSIADFARIANAL